MEVAEVLIDRGAEVNLPNEVSVLCVYVFLGHCRVYKLMKLYVYVIKQHRAVYMCRCIIHAKFMSRVLALDMFSLAGM